jgi:hypothetical protein
VAARDAAADRGWVLAGDEPGLGAPLTWAQRSGVADLHVLVDPADNVADPPRLARRAGEFAVGPGVWSVAGRALSPVDPAPPEDPSGADALPAEAAAWARVMIDVGVEPVVEHGVLRGDVLGLEVARLVPDGQGGWRLEVGVGHHDREARRELRPDEDPLDGLRHVAEVVRTWRSPDARTHPANTLAPERWLRSVLVERPHLVGAGALAAVAPPIDRADLRHRSPAPAAGADEDGEPLVVVCSTGIDVELVPAAADSRLLDGRDARLVIVVPEGDDHPVTRTLAGRLRRPAEVRTVSRDWPTLTWAPAS